MNGEIEMEIKTKKYRVMEDLMMKILLYSNVKTLSRRVAVSDFIIA